MFDFLKFFKISDGIFKKSEEKRENIFIIIVNCCDSTETYSYIFHYVSFS